MPLRHELRLHGLCEEIVLDSFSETEVADYIAERLPSIARDEGPCGRCTSARKACRCSWRRHERVTAPRGRLERCDTATSSLADVAVPENLLAIIEHYIARLGNERRSLLAAAAVCGMEFRVDTVARCSSATPPRFGRVRAALARAALAGRSARHEGGDAQEEPYSFRHALFRQVLYDRMASRARVELHRKVGTVLERERAAGGRSPPLSSRRTSTSARSPMEALRYYAEAAEAALMHFGPANA